MNAARASAPTLAVWTVRTEVFDGPLDLLLHLVRKDGIELRDIRIARLCDSYLVWLDAMRDLHFGIAGDYLVMAATLCRLKALELLPRAPTAVLVEDDVDPRQALVRKLAEHQRYKDAAKELEAREWLNRDVFARPVDDGPVPRPLAAGVDAFGLLDVYFSILQRAAAPDPIHEVHASTFDMGKLCRAVLAQFSVLGSRLELGDVLLAFPSRLERIVGFLGVLEMARLGWLGIEQAEPFGPVVLEARVGPDVDLLPLVGRMELLAG